MCVFSHSDPFLPYVRAHSSHISPSNSFFEVTGAYVELAKLNAEIALVEQQALSLTHTHTDPFFPHVTPPFCLDEYTYITPRSFFVVCRGRRRRRSIRLSMM